MLNLQHQHNNPSHESGPHTLGPTLMWGVVVMMLCTNQIPVSIISNLNRVIFYDKKILFFNFIYLFFGPPSPQTASPMHTERGHLFIWGCIAWTAYREVLGAFSNHFDFTGSPGLGEVSVWHGTCVLYDLALGTSVAFLSVLSSANVAYS